MTFTKLLVIILLFSEALLMIFFIIQIKNIGSNKPIAIERPKPLYYKTFEFPFDYISIVSDPFYQNHQYVYETLTKYPNGNVAYGSMTEDAITKQIISYNLQNGREVSIDSVITPKIRDDQTICFPEFILKSKCTDHDYIIKNLKAGKIHHIRCACGWSFSGYLSIHDKLVRQ